MNRGKIGGRLNFWNRVKWFFLICPNCNKWKVPEIEYSLWKCTYCETEIKPVWEHWVMERPI